MTSYKTSKDYTQLFWLIVQNDFDAVVFVHDDAPLTDKPCICTARYADGWLSVGYPGMGYITINESRIAKESDRLAEFISLCEHYKLEWIKPAE